jgi:5-methylcytosine-specific restriction protein A
MNDEILCPLCGRPNLHPTDHHLVPKSRGGMNGNKLTMCRDCHHAAHLLFSNKELERKYHTIEALLNHPKMLKMVKYITKQDPGGRVRFPAKRRFGGGKLRSVNPWN